MAAKLRAVTLSSRLRAAIPVDVLRDGGGVFAALISANILTYSFYALVSREIGVAASGIFTALLSAMLIASLPSAVVAVVFAKVSADRCAIGDLGEIRALGLGASWLAVVVGVGAFLAAELMPGVFAEFFHVTDSRTIMLAVVGYAFTFAIPMQRSVLQGAGAFRPFTISNIVEALVKCATGVCVFAFRLGIIEALAGYAAAEAVTFLFNGAVIVRRFPGGGIRWVSTLVDLGKSSLGIIVPIGAITSMTFLDVILVQHYLPGREAGLYGVAALFGRALLTAIAFAPAVLLPKAVERISAGQSAVPLLVSTLAATAAVAFAVLGLTIIMPRIIIEALAGPKFLGATPLMLPYATAMTGLAGATVLSTYLIALGRRAFAIPLAIVAACEAITIAFFRHGDLGQVLAVVVIGHTAGFAVCLASVVASVRAGVPRPGLRYHRP
ncbi:MAG: hypothetical protein WCE44_05635 [Candidatus Velthaea sp.]